MNHSDTYIIIRSIVRGIFRIIATAAFIATIYFIILVVAA
jgi:hypothetical protein